MPPKTKKQKRMRAVRGAQGSRESSPRYILVWYSSSGTLVPMWAFLGILYTFLWLLFSPTPTFSPLCLPLVGPRTEMWALTLQTCLNLSWVLKRGIVASLSSHVILCWGWQSWWKVEQGGVQESPFRGSLELLPGTNPIWLPHSLSTSIV